MTLLKIDFIYFIILNNLHLSVLPKIFKIADHHFFKSYSHVDMDEILLKYHW